MGGKVENSSVAEFVPLSPKVEKSSVSLPLAFNILSSDFEEIGFGLNTSSSTL